VLEDLSVGEIVEIAILIGSLVYFKARTEARLDSILEQTTRTNGRLAKAEDKLQEHGERLATLEAD
jgi:hypothetical protein